MNELAGGFYRGRVRSMVPFPKDAWWSEGSVKMCRGYIINPLVCREVSG